MGRWGDRRAGSGRARVKGGELLDLPREDGRHGVDFDRELEGAFRHVGGRRHGVHHSRGYATKTLFVGEITCSATRSPFELTPSALVLPAIAVSGSVAVTIAT